MQVLTVTDERELDKSLKLNSKGLTVLYFYVEDSAECTQMSDVITELKNDSVYQRALLIKVNASKLIDVAKKHDVESVPAFIFITKNEVIDKLVGANVPAFSKKLKENFDKVEEERVRALNARLSELINKAPVMLFMKGDPSNPQCGFSKQVIILLKNHDAKYETFDILKDYEVREGLKKFSNWPTYPQLYVKGELIGGLDILKELSISGELNDILAV